MSGCEVTVRVPRGWKATSLCSLYALLGPPVVSTTTPGMGVCISYDRNKLHGVGLLGTGSSCFLSLGKRIRGKGRAGFSALATAQILSQHLTGLFLFSPVGDGRGTSLSLFNMAR